LPDIGEHDLRIVPWSLLKPRSDEAIVHGEQRFDYGVFAKFR